MSRPSKSKGELLESPSNGNDQKCPRVRDDVRREDGPITIEETNPTRNSRQKRRKNRLKRTVNIQVIPTHLTETILHRLHLHLLRSHQLEHQGFNPTYNVKQHFHQTESVEKVCHLFVLLPKKRLSVDSNDIIDSLSTERTRVFSIGQQSSAFITTDKMITRTNYTITRTIHTDRTINYTLRRRRRRCLDVQRFN